MPEPTEEPMKDAIITALEATIEALAWPDLLEAHQALLRAEFPSVIASTYKYVFFRQRDLNRRQNRTAAVAAKVAL